MNTLFKAVCTVVLAASAIGCNPFFVEVEAPRVCERTQAVTFDGVPASVPGAVPDVTLEKVLEYPLANELGDTGPVDIETQVKLLQVKFISADGNSLEFIKSARISILPSDGSTMVEKELLTFNRALPGGNPMELTLDSTDDSINVRDYAAGETIYLKSSLTGTWPQQGAVMDVGACVSMLAHANYL